MNDALGGRWWQSKFDRQNVSVGASILQIDAHHVFDWLPGFGIDDIDSTILIGTDQYLHFRPLFNLAWSGIVLDR